MSESTEPLSAEVNPEDYWRTRRLQDIADARAELRHVKNSGYDGKFSSWEIQEAMHQAAKNFILELESLLRRLDAGEDYWNGKLLGEIEYTGGWKMAAERIAAGENNASRDKITEIKILDDPITVEGLEEFLALSSPVRWRVQGTYRSLTTGLTPTGVHIIKEPIPSRISENAWRLANRFCSDVGLDVKLDEADQHDYV